LATVIAFRRRTRRRTRIDASSIALALVLAVLIATGYLVVGQSPGAEPIEGVSFTMCGPTPHQDCVIDGDTFYLGTQSIRVADIDTPETHQPQCAYEAQLGAQATQRFLQLLNQGPIEIAMWDNRDEDQYGRKLRTVSRNGRSLGAILVSEGLAREWTGSRQPWC
jgi:endonuclease YncB( thermonuclease family)